MFWPEVLLQLLHGTSLQVASVHSDTSAMHEDFQQVQDTIERHPERFKDVQAAMDFAAFQRAAAWVSSRAFYVDGFHGVHCSLSHYSCGCTLLIDLTLQTMLHSAANRRL